MVGGPRQYHVVALADLERAEHGLDRGRAAFDIDHLVAQSVAVDRGRVSSDHIGQSHVGVSEDQPATGDRVRALSLVAEEVVQFEVAWSQRMVSHRGLVGQVPVV
jgi:hypothetical protein